MGSGGSSAKYKNSSGTESTEVAAATEPVSTQQPVSWSPKAIACAQTAVLSAADSVVALDHGQDSASTSAVGSSPCQAISIGKPAKNGVISIGGVDGAAGKGKGRQVRSGGYGSYRQETSRRLAAEKSIDCMKVPASGYASQADQLNSGVIVRRKWSKGAGKSQPDGLPPLRAPSPPPQQELPPEGFRSSSVVAKMASDYWRSEKRTPRALADKALADVTNQCFTCTQGRGVVTTSIQTSSIPTGTRAVTASSLSSISESTYAGTSGASTPSSQEIKA